MKPIWDHEAAYWINAGWEDYTEKGLTEPEHGRYGRGEEYMFAQLGFDRAKAGLPKIRTSLPE